jgi:hypothetical protein
MKETPSLKTHEMQHLGNNVYICPICLHMVRYIPGETRITVLVYGSLDVQHIGSTTPELHFSAANLLLKLDKLVPEAPTHPMIHLDTEVLYTYNGLMSKTDPCGHVTGIMFDN